MRAHPMNKNDVKRVCERAVGAAPRDGVLTCSSEFHKSHFDL